MMKKVLFLLSFWIHISISVANAEIKLQPYQFGDWSAITKKYPNQAVAIHFWGTTCGPCITELPEWGKYLKSDKNIKAIFVQVDDVSGKMIRKRLQSAKLEKYDHYYLVSNFDEFIYFEVDKTWHGEIPMTILLGKDGKKERILGSVEFKDIKKWAGKQASIQ